MLEKQAAESVHSFMEQSVLVVQASVQDNAPLTILEAHTAGKKVLGSLVGGIPELLDSEEVSWMYEAKNVNDLCAKLIHAISRKTDSTPLIHSSVESMTNTYLGHYLELRNNE
jgi:glycosyltransferase involved in cell wall biosynthesis